MDKKKISVIIFDHQRFWCIISPIWKKNNAHALSSVTNVARALKNGADQKRATEQGPRVDFMVSDLLERLCILSSTQIRSGLGYSEC